MSTDQKPKNRCETCAYWDDHGWCCAHPPTVILFFDKVETVWPGTTADEFCGEWQPQSWHEEVADAY